MFITIKLDGITPLLMNMFTDEDAASSSGGSRSSAAAQDRGTPLEAAEKRIYRDLKGEVCLPSPNVLRCIVDGGQFHKVGKAQITTKEKSLLYSCLDIEAATIPLVHIEPWRVDTRPVVIPSTKGRVLKHRPMFDDWSIEFELTLDTSLVNVKLLRAIVDDAGKRVGLGDFRPARKGPYGRFAVTKWVEVKEEKPNVAPLRKSKAA